MKRSLLVFITLCLVFAAQDAAAQDRRITGRVTAVETGNPLSGVQVMVRGTNIGTLTDASGRYALTAPATAEALVFSSIGYRSAEVPITASSIDVALATQAVVLEGLVVTALGVTREKSQLGTAQQQLTSEELNTTRTMNLVQQVQGKVSGIQIAGAGTPGGSTNVIIRGANSIEGSNQPLFIVDGVPVSNNNRNGRIQRGRQNLLTGFDYGNAISDLNPEDIETFTVLKGPNAAAIYGSRAANGVIIITTKRGAATTGRMRTEFTSTYTFERPMLLPDFQNQYGQGAEGEFGWFNGRGGGNCDGCDQSWGPKLDGRLICQFNSPGAGTANCQATPWVPNPNNVRDFFQTGNTFASTLAVSGGTERATARLSVGWDNVNGYVPGNTFEKFSTLLSGQLQVTDRLNTNATVQYIRNDARNRVGTGYLNSILEQFFWFGRQVDINALRQYQQGGRANNGPATREYNWNYNYHNNPWWIQFENPIDDLRDRYILSGSASYQLTDWLNASLRSGSDIYRFEANQRFAPGNLNGFVNQSFNGGFTFINEYNNEHNSELLLTANRALIPNLTLDAMAGGGLRRERYTDNTAATTGISVPGIFNVSNAAITPTLTQLIQKRDVNSVFGSLALTWDGWWTVEGTARNDWSSTLPAGANSYFYPSVNTSVVITDAVPALRNELLSYLKVRGSVARVGSDAAPYQLQTTYTGISQQFRGLPQFTLGDALANAQLKPEITTANEVGIELGLLDNRVVFDGTYYTKATRNQIFNVPISPTSGFSTQAINAGEITNQGFEALLSVTPLRLANGLRWTSTFNYAHNRNQVTELYPGVETILLGQGIFADMRLEARVGQPYGAIFGGVFARDEATGKILTENGLPVHKSGFEYLGSIQPDWTGGWNNEIAFRNVSLGALVDIRRGGKIFSYTNLVGEYSGVLTSSLRGREVDWDNPGLVVDGIDVATGQPNTVRVTAEEYFQSLFPVSEPYVYDASYVKLREVRLGYEVPQRWTFGAEGVSLALTARNLALWTDVPNIDPEFTYSSGNFQGVEYAIPANPRVIGLSVRIRP